MIYKKNWSKEEKIEALKKELVNSFKFKTIDNVKFEKIKRHKDFFGEKQIWNYGFEIDTNKLHIFVYKNNKIQLRHKMDITYKNKDFFPATMYSYLMHNIFKNTEKDIIKE